jgi:hypothetical protein
MDWNTIRRPAVVPAGFVEPCNPTVPKRAPSGPQWIHEIKHDRYRMILRRAGDRARVFAVPLRPQQGVAEDQEPSVTGDGLRWQETILRDSDILDRAC